MIGWEDMGIGVCGCGDERMLFRKLGETATYCGPCTMWRDKHGDLPRPQRVQEVAPSKSLLRAQRLAERRDRIRSLYDAGMHKMQIAREVGVHWGTVYEVLHGPRGNR